MQDDCTPEAREQSVKYDEWFLTEVDKGLKQIENGQTLSHAEAGARLAEMIAAKKQRA